MKTIWQLFTYWPKYEVAVIEMGIDSAAEPKNMSYLLKILRPNIAVLLNASSVHGANFPGPDVTQSIAHEKAKLLYAVPNTGLAIFSTDSSEIANAVAHLSVPQQTFSISGASSDLYLTDYAVTTKGTTFSFVYDQQKYQLHFENACHIKAAFGSFAAAFLVGNKLGISIDTASRALEKNFTLPAGRMSLFKGIKDSTILDSSYNSSPEATQSALEMLSTIPTKGKRIAILGDMRELGIATQAEHEKIAQTAVKHADTIFLIGTSMKEYAVPILEKNKKKVIAFTTAWEAIDAVKNEVERDDLILIKGSQNTIFLEIIVEALLAHPEQDIPKLCRRGEYWDKQRNNLK